MERKFLKLSEVYSKKIDNKEKLSMSQKMSDKVANLYGSWKFIIAQTLIMIVWIIWNSVDGLPHWDEAPYSQLNLILSFIAGYTGSFLQMSQNRQSAKDRKTFEHDYEIDVLAGKDLEKIKEMLNILINKK